MSELTYAELCAGYGGLGMGIQSVLGGRMAWCAEFDEAPSRILAHHWPDVPNVHDITSLDWQSLPKVDVLTAGFPCQPFSHAGKRLGARDPRHLWPYIQEGINILRPRLVVLENVRGLLTAQGEADTDEIAELDDEVQHLQRAVALVQRKQRKAKRDGATFYAKQHQGDAIRLMARRDRKVAALRRARKRLVRAIGTVVGGLADIGYDAWWYGLRAADVGAAHGRFRVFIFAVPAADARRSRGQQTVQHHGRGPARSNRAGVPHQPDRDVVRTGPVRDGLVLLKTPTSQLAENGGSQHPDKRKAGGHGPTLADEVEHLLPGEPILPTPRAAAGMRSPLRPHAADTSRLEDAVATSLLPTPCANDFKGATEERKQPGKHRHQLDAFVEGQTLLPTPRATDGTKGGPNQRGSSGDLMLPSVAPMLATPTARDYKGETGHGYLPDQVSQLLPTPTTMDSHSSGGGYNGQANVTLTDATARQGAEHVPSWGEYGPAIARHAAMVGRPAPAPTEPGRNGAPRLSPRFVEWLMGLPEGHVTDPAIGISRNEELKALGNGVVPQQSAAACLAFLKDSGWRP